VSFRRKIRSGNAGAKAHHIKAVYAALKRRSSTVAPAAVSTAPTPAFLELNSLLFDPAKARYNRGMPPAPGATKAVGMVPDEMKAEPKSTGISTPRKKKPKELAVITECCTGCAGSPACVEYCPVEDCMFWVADEDSTPFGRIAVDPILCIGCKKCLSKGPDGCFLDGCPWDAIAMVDIAEVEKEVGPMAI